MREDARDDMCFLGWEFEREYLSLRSCWFFWCELLLGLSSSWRTLEWVSLEEGCPLVREPSAVVGGFLSASRSACFLQKGLRDLVAAHENIPRKSVVLDGGELLSRQHFLGATQRLQLFEQLSASLQRLSFVSVGGVCVAKPLRGFQLVAVPLF